MPYKITYAADAERDFELIIDFLVESYISFGDSREDAITHALDRVTAITDDIEMLCEAPYRGTLHDDILPGLRHLTLGKAVIWFDIVEDCLEVRILAIFFGGQDHIRHMLARLLQ